MRQVLILLIVIILNSCSDNKRHEIKYSVLLDDLKKDSLLSEKEELYLESLHIDRLNYDSIFSVLRSAFVSDQPESIQTELRINRLSVIEAMNSSLYPGPDGLIFLWMEDEEKLKIQTGSRKFVSLLRGYEIISDSSLEKLERDIDSGQIIFKIDVLNKINDYPQ